jgi:hypothetical protein
MQDFSPNRVRFLEAETVETNVKSIQEDISDLVDSNEIEAKVLFSKMVEWLQKNKA